MQFEVYEPDFYENEEEIIKLYNEEYEVLFNNCDSRITFKKDEKLKLENYVVKYRTYLKELYSVKLALFELNFNDNEYNIYLDNFQKITRYIERIKSKSETIRQNAENRFMKYTFKNNVDLIVEDAERRLEQVIKYSNLFYFHPDLIKNNVSKKGKYKAFFLSLIQTIPMHLRYLSEINQTGILIERLNSRVNNLRLYFNDYELSEVLDQFIGMHTRINSNEYVITRYAPPLAYFSMISSKSHFKPISNTSLVKAEKNGLTVNIQISEKDNEFVTQSMHQLLDYIIILFNLGGCNDSEVVIDISIYTKLRGLTSDVKVADQVKKSLDKLSNICISYSPISKVSKTNKKYEMKETKIISDIFKKRKGRIKVKLTDEFAEVISGFPIMQYSNKLFEFNEKENPNSYYLLKRLLWHRNINHNHANPEIISVKNLVEACPNLVKYDDIVNAGQIRQRIIDPFERDLNNLSEVLTWSYEYNKSLISIEELHTLNFDKFIELKIHVYWRNYPIEKKNKKKDLDNDTY